MSEKTKLIVKGMTCHHCEMTIEISLKEISDVLAVKADAKKNEVQVESKSKLDFEKIGTIINSLGYELIK